MSEEVLTNAGSAPRVDEPTARRSLAGWMTAWAVLVYVLLVWGALVRLTGSGLSIPDWPFINGSLLPPMSGAAWTAALDDYTAEAIRVADPRFPVEVTVPRFREMFWIEYLHRTLAALAGIMFLVIAFKALSRADLRSETDSNIYTLAALLLAQALMGGVVVLSALPGLLVAVHLVLGYIFFAAVIWTALGLVRPAVSGAGSRSAGFTPVLLGWAMLLGFGLQAFFGGLTAGLGRQYIAATWPLMFGRFLPPASLWISPYHDGLFGNLFGNSIPSQFIHRWWAFVLLGLFVWLWLKTLATPLNPRGRAALQAAGGLFAVQIMVGIFNALYTAPTALSTLHSAIGAALLASLVVLLHELRYGVIEPV